MREKPAKPATSGKCYSHAKILEEVNEKSKEKLSKNILQDEDGNIPLQQQAGYKFSELASKLISRSFAYHSLLIEKGPSNDLLDKYKSPRLP